MLLAARVEQLGRTEQELSQAQVQLTEQQTEFDTTRATLRWAEQVSAERLRLLQAQQQLRRNIEERARSLEERARNLEERAETEQRRLADAIAHGESEAAARTEAERRLAEALALAQAEAERVRSIETSTIWRASSVLRHVFASHPRLRRAIKIIVRPMVRGLRWGLGRDRHRTAET